MGIRNLSLEEVAVAASTFVIAAFIYIVMVNAAANVTMTIA